MDKPTDEQILALFNPKEHDHYFSHETIEEEGVYCEISDVSYKALILAKQIWNLAIETAAENAQTKLNDESTSIIVDKESITKLKYKL